MKKMIPLFIAIISAVLLILAAIYQYQIKEEERKEKDIQKQKAIESEKIAKDFQNKLIQKTESLDSANQEIRNLQNQLIQNTRTLLGESKNLQESQSETIKFMTGNGYPILNFYPKDDMIHSVIFYNRTGYPIYDMRIRVDDFDELKKCNPIITKTKVLLERDCVLKISKRSGPIFMSPGQNSPIDFDFNLKERKHYLIETINRQGIFEYLCILEPSDKKINYCIRIYQKKNDKSMLLDEQEFGLKAPNEDYWNNNFYADKQILFGPMKELK